MIESEKMIYELINSDMLKDHDASVICGIELAAEFYNDICESENENEGFYWECDNKDIEAILSENKLFICSKIFQLDGSIAYFIEPLLKEDGCQYMIESEFILIQDNLLDVIDLDYIDGELLTFEVKEYEEECDYEYSEKYYIKYHATLEDLMKSMR